MTLSNTTSYQPVKFRPVGRPDTVNPESRPRRATMFRYAGSSYHSVDQLRRRLQRDKAAFEAQAAVYRRLWDLLEDELAAASDAGLALEQDVLQTEVDRLIGLEQEMQSSADSVDIELSALARGARA